jgi:ABC-type dipeptide/oligopeptide/nickel transport system permease component
MASYILKRLFFSALTVFFLLLVTFLLMHAVPGSPVDDILGDKGGTAEERARLAHQAGLDRPLIIQFVTYVRNFCRGDMGTIFATGQNVSEEVKARLPNTVKLALLAMALASFIGIAAGLCASKWQGRWIDTLARALTVLAISSPIFWFGLILIFIFAYTLEVLPPGGSGEGSLRYLILPALALGLRPAAFIARVTRSNMLDVLSEDYILTARAKGLSETSVILKHALRNILVPVVTIIGMDLGNLLGGTVITEVVFSFKGIGKFAIDAILNRWYEAIMATALLWGIIFIAANLVVDLFYGVLDPRIRIETRLR